MRFSELANKDVINVGNGELLGQVHDVEFDETYRIRILYVSLQLTGIRRIFPWLFTNEEQMIHIEEIVRIGKDVILIKSC
ncbi:PRC-barrel domain-containing protein [Merdibacter massiliensis]|uniref:PRC-barrel domain-containing protein n=1 Tax=Merdibacter massiliensis TaxID=1871030 RepID=UPI00096A77B7|nr:PRC-barrel domain-containing protein [Merdibacter massiliensis]